MKKNYKIENDVNGRWNVYKRVRFMGIPLWWQFIQSRDSEGTAFAVMDRLRNKVVKYY
jgi:hypothetical protein